MINTNLHIPLDDEHESESLVDQISGDFTIEADSVEDIRIQLKRILDESKL